MTYPSVHRHGVTIAPRPPTFSLRSMPKEHKQKIFQIKPVNLGFACRSIWLYLLAQCKWKSNHLRATFIVSENRQFLIVSIYDGNPVLLTFLCWELNCGSFGEMRAWIPGAKYKKETIQCLGQFQPAFGPLGLLQWHFACQRAVPPGNPGLWLNRFKLASSWC